MLREDNRAKASLKDDYPALLQHRPDDLKPAVATVSIANCRVTFEILKQHRHYLDLETILARLQPGKTKKATGGILRFNRRLQ